MKSAREWAQQIWSDEGPLVNGWDEVERIITAVQDDAQAALSAIATGMTTYPGRGPKHCKWCKGKPAHRDGRIEHDPLCPTEVARRALASRASCCPSRGAPLGDGNGFGGCPNTECDWKPEHGQ